MSTQDRVPRVRGKAHMNGNVTYEANNASGRAFPRPFQLRIDPIAASNGSRTNAGRRYGILFSGLISVESRGYRPSPARWSVAFCLVRACSPIRTSRTTLQDLKESAKSLLLLLPKAARQWPCNTFNLKGNSAIKAPELQT